MISWSINIHPKDFVVHATLSSPLTFIERYPRYIEPLKKIEISVISLLKGTVMQIYNNKYMIASTQITNTESFAFIAVFKLLSSKVLFKNRKDNRNC